MSAISKPTPSQIGAARDCLRNLNGNVLRLIVRSKAISSRTSSFIREHRQDRIDNFANCLVTFGNGREARIPPTLVIVLRPARLVNTTASLCATSMSCAAVPAPLLGLIFAAPIAIFSNPTNAGNSQGFGSRATQHEPRDTSAGRRRILAGEIGLSFGGMCRVLPSSADDSVK